MAAGPGVPGGESLAGKAPAAGGVRLIAEEQAALRRVAVLVAQGEPPEEGFAAVAAEAGQVLHAPAIGTAQARGGLRGFAAGQAALRRVAVLVARGASPEEVFAAVAGEAARVLGAAVTTLARYDPDGAETVVGAWTGTPAAVP